MQCGTAGAAGRKRRGRACRYGSLECVKVLTSQGANVSHRDEDGMSVLEHAEQNDRRQVVSLIKRAQLASQMRQRRKAKRTGPAAGLSGAEYARKEAEAREKMAALLAELEEEEEGAEARRARQRAKRTAKKSEKKGGGAKRKDVRLARRTGGGPYTQPPAYPSPSVVLSHSRPPCHTVGRERLCMSQRCPPALQAFDALACLCTEWCGGHSPAASAAVCGLLSVRLQTWCQPRTAVLL